MTKFSTLGFGEFESCTQNSLNVFYSKWLSDFEFLFKFCNICRHIMVSWGWKTKQIKTQSLIVSYALYMNSLRNPFPSIFSMLVFNSNLSWEQNFPIWDDMCWHPSFRFYCLWIGGFQSSTAQSIDIWKRQNCPPWGLPIYQLKLFILLDAEVLC